MLDAINVKTLTENSAITILGYKDCLKEMMRNNPSNDCHLDKCGKCPGTKKISEHLLNI